MKAVVRNNQVIHIGELDFHVDGAGNEANPIPEGAVYGEFDVVKTAQGKFVLRTDYAALRADEYPPIGDQLDALFKAGVFPEDMASLIAEVKAKYPKPSGS